MGESDGGLYVMGMGKAKVIAFSKQKSRLAASSRRRRSQGSPTPDQASQLGIERSRPGFGAPITTRSMAGTGSFFGMASRHATLERRTLIVEADDENDQRQRPRDNSALRNIKETGEDTSKKKTAPLFEEEHLRFLLGDIDPELAVKVRDVSAHLEHFFEEADTNDDGRLSYSEIKGIFQQFGDAIASEVNLFLKEEEMEDDAGLDLPRFTELFLHMAVKVCNDPALFAQARIQHPVRRIENQRVSSLASQMRPSVNADYYEMQGNAAFSNAAANRASMGPMGRRASALVVGLVGGARHSTPGQANLLPNLANRMSLNKKLTEGLIVDDEPDSIGNPRNLEKQGSHRDYIQRVIAEDMMKHSNSMDSGPFAIRGKRLGAAGRASTKGDDAMQGARKKNRPSRLPDLLTRTR